MSHNPERKKNDCLNCNAVVYGRYCHLCGQENVEPKETFWHLVTHLVYDITHFDGKFFSTVKYLLLKPGYLSKEYIRGKRMSYLNPIKMYVFVSAFFFIFFFALFNSRFNLDEKETKPTSYKEVKAKIEDKIAGIESTLKDSALPDLANKMMQNQLNLLQQDLATLQKDTTHIERLNYFNNKDVAFTPSRYNDPVNNDSVQNSLPVQKRDGWAPRLFQKKLIQLKTKYGNNVNVILEKMLEKFFHFFPQVFYVSLPLIALLLKLLYARRKNFYYVDHIIYSVHLYCAVFILMFLLLSISRWEAFNYLHWLKYITWFLNLYIVWYVYKSLKNFYEQGRGKTILKFFLLLLASSIVMSLLFIAFFVLSMFTV